MALNAQLPNSAPNPILSDVGSIWQNAVEHYERTTGVKIEQLAKAQNVQQILDDIGGKESRFRLHRHDGSKIDKFRTLVSQSLSPIQSVADIVAHATKSVSCFAFRLTDRVPSSDGRFRSILQAKLFSQLSDTSSMLVWVSHRVFAYTHRT